VSLLGIALVLTGPLARRVATLFAFVLLVPDTLVLPGTSTWVPVDRLVLLAFVFGLAVMLYRGELPMSALRPTRAQAALALFLVVAFVSGITIDPGANKLSSSLFIFTLFLAQLVLLTAVLVATRVLGPRNVARSLAIAAVVLAAIALSERLFHYSYARWWFDHLPNQLSSVQAQPLETRGATVRVRGSAQFALEFGWICAMTLPLVAVLSTRARRPLLALLGPALVALGVLLSVSRSPLLGLAAALAVLLLGARFERRITVLVLAGALAGGLLFAATPDIRSSFASAQKTDSLSSRERRRDALTEQVSRHPYTGLGLAGPFRLGFRGTDTTYLFIYSSLGAPGVLAFSAALLTGLATALSAMRQERQQEAALAAAVVAGILAGLVGTGAFDLFTAPSSAQLFWILVALAAALAEGRARPTRRRPSPARFVALPLAGVGVGLLVWALTPMHSAYQFEFDAISPGLRFTATGNQQFVGAVLVNTDCGVIRRVVATHSTASVKCENPQSGVGVGNVRLEGRTTSDVRKAAAAVVGIGQQYRLGGVRRAKPTWARTAPAIGGAAGLAAALLIPAIVVDPALRRRVPLVPAAV
jgi:O-antigen ligase